MAVTVSKIPTVINVNNSTLNLKVNDEVASGATLTPADAGDLTYTSSNSSVAIVENGVIKALTNGTVIITVSFAGNGTYAAAENKTITVNVCLDASVSVNNDTLDLNVDDTFTLIPTTTPEGLAVTYQSNNESVVTVDSNGNITAIGEGNAIITVKVGGDGVYIENSTLVTVTVSKIPATINLTNDSFTLNIDDSIDTGASLTPADAGNLTYTSSDTNVAKVENGKIIAVGPGSAKITVSLAGNEKYAAENKTIQVTVNKKTTPQPTPSKVATKIIANKKTFTLEEKNKKYTITLKNSKGKTITKAPVTLKIKGKKYTAKTNNKGIATFKIKLNKKGKYTATIKYAGNSKYKQSTKKVKITIKPFKKIGKGSKDKATVKKIQKALKKNGYYLHAENHYLKIDGKYHKWTARAVKKYQKDNKLKATGTVDYTTALKLGII